MLFVKIIRALHTTWDGTKHMTINPLFETFYSAFKQLVDGNDGEQGMPVHLALQKLPEEYRAACFERYSNRIIVVTPVVVRRRKPEWRPDYSSARGRHWSSLRQYLLSEKERPVEQVDSLDEASDSVLFSLGDPKRVTSAQNLVGQASPSHEVSNGLTIEPPAGPGKLIEYEAYKGLVVGYVQSGKTANYTALTAKAFDAGYELVIVLTGIHNALRRQTQRRMNEELGTIASSPMRRTAREFDPTPELPHVQTLTNEDLTNGDFQYQNLSAQILNTGKFLVVTKKNASVLRRLIAWLGKVQVSTLIIDDEADQASVNTRGQGNQGPVLEGDDVAGISAEDDPATINKLIRTLVKNCKANRAYIGYTATPYANVFIQQDAFNPRFEEDLFPDDFIISLEKPVGYMGPQEFFGDSIDDPETSADSISDRVVQIVDEADADKLEDLTLPDAQHGNVLEVLPESLKVATRAFVLSTAIKFAFEGKRTASSFLVHTSHKQELQGILGLALERYLKHLVGQWRNDYSEAREMFRREWMQATALVQNPSFQVAFEDVEVELEYLLGKYQTIRLLVLNHKSEDELDYELDPDLIAVIVGGNKLSRGLTLEGLVTSYFVRKAANPQADTLTQMGRFFGYRGALVDITKVFTTDALRDSFRDVALVETSLRMELLNLEKLGLTPRDFAPRVRKMLHLLPTARNKMRAAKEFGASYSGALIQMTSFPKGVEVHRANLEATTKFVKALDSRNYPRENQQLDDGETTRWLWRNVEAKDVIEYLRGFKVSEAANRFNTNNILGYISSQVEGVKAPGSEEKVQELGSWSVLIAGRAQDSALGEESFGLSMRLGRVSRGLLNDSKSSVKSIITPVSLSNGNLRGDEILDYSPGLISQLEAELAVAENSDEKVADFVRRKRNPSNGLMIIYPISPASVRKAARPLGSKNIGQVLFGNDDNVTIVGLALVFPHSDADDLDSRQYWQQEVRNGQNVTD